MAISPLNESGDAVDWWFLYKVPKLKASSMSDSAVGYEYAYYDAAAEEIVRSPYMINGKQGALRLTLNQLFDKKSRTATSGYILYNDEPPSKKVSETFGHTKGVIGFDEESDTAFWLLHSWPKYPNQQETATPSPDFGQTYLCISLDMAGVRALAAQMLHYQQPYIYDAMIPKSFAADDPLRVLTTSVKTTDPAGSNTITLTSQGGKQFMVIAKDRNWNKDFWNELVVDEISSNIDCETWIRVTKNDQIPPAQDDNGKYYVYDIKYITFKDIGLPWAWPEHDDHAKWAISFKDNWICVGDINRMTSQEKRGGGTIAFQDGPLWSMLSKTDLLKLPPGWTKTQAKQAIRSSQRAIKEKVAKQNAATTTSGETASKAASTAKAKSAAKTKAATKPAATQHTKRTARTRNN